ncbi:hypothetical protein RJT34_24001 [Clitoria ternatea]|uniref:BHLH domain-containing protein n=1 Tax=Clitoria ternatea TaxID=43366 RepID=A0AAN9FMH4_CLITE
MLALSPPLFSSIGWAFEEPVSQYLNREIKSTSIEEASEIFESQLCSSQAQVETLYTPSPGVTSSMVKKLNHNASERDRRKKINSLYSSLRSLLPLHDQTKKLSIPSTISRVLKYIPELQQQVEGLTKKKEEILLRISHQGDAVINKESERKISHHNLGFAVSTSRLSDNEVAIQISSSIVHKISLSDILLCLENDGLVILNVSSSETYGERIFYNLHIQVDKFQRLESKILSEKLLSIIENKKGVF